MSALSRTAKVQLSGGAGAVVSLALLIMGLWATGGGHGSYTLWFVGLAMAGVSGLLLVAGTAGAIWKKEKKGFVYGVIAIAAFVSVALYFFDIAAWISDALF